MRLTNVSVNAQLALNLAIAPAMVEHECPVLRCILVPPWQYDSAHYRAFTEIGKPACYENGTTIC